MPEQPPSFVVVDKRKFTPDGEVRQEGREEQAEQPAAAAAEPPSSKVVTMPVREAAAADDLAEESMSGSVEPTARQAEDQPEAETDVEEAAFLNAQTPEQAAAQESAYKESTKTLDAMLKQANPGMEAPGAASFEHLVQSFYLSAIMAMGAGAEPGQKPRVDILGARQAIDLLGVLEEKTRGNLTRDEQQLLQSITFELRMAFLELTNAISRQALKGAPKPPGGAR